MDGRRRDGGAFLSPVSGLRRAEAEQQRAQEERVRAVPLSQSQSQLLPHAKRKQTEMKDHEVWTTSAAVKRRRRSPPEREFEAQAEEKSPRYLSYERRERDEADVVADRRTPRELAFPPGDDEQRMFDEENAPTQGDSDDERWSGGLERGEEPSSDQEDPALALFARYKDPMVRHRKETTTLAAVEKPARPFSVETATPRQLYRRLYGEDASEDTWAYIQRNSATHGMVDLSSTPDLSRLETVEGPEILDTLLTTNTPRVGRRFPAEESRTESEEREHSFLRRRLIARRKKYSVKQMTAKWESEAAHFGDAVTSSSPGSRLSASTSLEEDLRLPLFRDSPIRVRSPLMSIGLSKEDSPPKKPRSLPEEAESEEEGVDDSLNIIEDDEDSDTESTAAVLLHLREIKYVTWFYFLPWLVAGSLLLCTVVVTAPYMRRLSEPQLPFCDSTWSDTDSETRAISSIQELTQASALQPYVTLSALAEHPSCQPCPLYGNCLSGEVLSCSPPYELHNGVCVENPEVRDDLARIASGIEQFVVARVTDRTCQDISAWSYVIPVLLKDENATSFDLATPVQVLISELREFVASTVHYGSAVLDLPRDYIFHRSLVMALRNLRDIVVGGDIDGADGRGIIYVGTALAPWTCQAQHRLYSHMYVIAVAILLGALSRYLCFRRASRGRQNQLVDRLFKETRFSLMHRAGGPQRLYPAEHLCEDLLDAHSIPLQERSFMRKATWPKVLALLAKDPRINSQTIKLHGKDTLVLEWASEKKAVDAPGRRRDRRRARMSLPARTTLP